MTEPSKENSDLKYFTDLVDERNNRYMEAEDFILQLAEMSWYKRMFCLGKIMKFLDSRSKFKF